MLTGLGASDLRADPADFCNVCNSAMFAIRAIRVIRGQTFLFGFYPWSSVKSVVK